MFNLFQIFLMQIGLCFLLIKCTFATCGADTYRHHVWDSTALPELRTDNAPGTLHTLPMGLGRTCPLCPRSWKPGRPRSCPTLRVSCVRAHLERKSQSRSKRRTHSSGQDEPQTSEVPTPEMSKGGTNDTKCQLAKPCTSSDNDRQCP